MKLMYFEVVELQIKIKDYSNAMRTLNRVINSSSHYDSAFFLYERGRLKAILKDYRGAISDFDLALKYDDKLEIVYSARADAKFEIKDYVGAISDYTLRIQLHPNDSAKEYFNRGQLRLALNQKEAACMDFSKAGEQGIHKAYDLIKTYCN